MRLAVANTGNPDSLASRMRRQRLSQFLDLLPSGRVARVLDVGGTIAYWNNALGGSYDGLEITVVNLNEETSPSDAPIRTLYGDARDLRRFRNNEFDYCFSNSVIEHVGTLGDQLKMANEVRRVARGYFIQTPYRYFPLEPHFHFPVWAQLPVWVRTALHQRMNLGWLKAAPDYLQAKIDVEQIRLLSVREFQLLFPDAEIRREKFRGLTKSLMAVRRYPA